MELCLSFIHIQIFQMEIASLSLILIAPKYSRLFCRGRNLYKMTKWKNHSRRLFIQKLEEHYFEFQFNDVVFTPLAKACGIAELMRERFPPKMEKILSIGQAPLRLN